MLPTLKGQRVTLRPGTAADEEPLAAIRAEPAVVAWWDAPAPGEPGLVLRGEEAGTHALVIEFDGRPCGLIQYAEEDDPAFRSASIDLFLATALHGRGLGREAIALLVAWLFDERAHHRLTIDPAAANEPAIRCYEAVGFRRVGVMRRYQRLADGRFLDGLLLELVRD